MTSSINANFLSLPAQPVAPVAAQDHERLLPPEPIPPKPPEAYKPEEPHVFEKPTFIPAKPVPHSPKISPSSIPIPSPSVTTTKHLEPGYPNYGGYLYSIPGYSAFQPVSHSGIPGYHPGLVQQNQPLLSENSDFLPFTPPNMVKSKNEPIEEENADTDAQLMVTDDEETQQPQAQPQTDFEDHFTPEIISTVPSVSTSEATKPTESKMSITSLAQGSGATVTIPSLIPTKDIKKKPERFSLKTSIPISKIDMKCVSNPPDLLFQNSLTKKSFKTAVPKDTPRIEIQSNIVIKSATKETEPKETTIPVVPVKSNTIKTLINAAEAINKTENQFRVPEIPKADSPPEAKKPVPPSKPLFNPMNIETTKASFTKPLEREAYSSDAKNQILFIQNKNNNNPNSKMLLTIQPQNPQVLLQRTNIDSKNLQAPSRLSNQSKKSKDDVMNEGTSSKVVALKRLHQENCDENDFENLITENQIYGNKIVVKEKSQGTLQEKDLKHKKMVAEKVTTNEPKSMVLQPNFLYLSNVQFPNMMIVKNCPKITQTADSNKIKLVSNESNIANVNETVPTTDVNTVSSLNKSVKSTLSVLSKDIQAVKSSNNMQPTLQIKTKPDQPKPAVKKSDTITIAKPENTATKSDIMIPKPDTEVTKPDIVIPDIVIPNTAMSDMAIPDIVIPNMTMSDMVIPDIVIPNMAMPDMVLPNMTMPDMVIPNMTMPDIVIPNMTMPDVVIPDIVITQPDIVITQPNLIITQPNIVFTQPEYIFQANQNVIMNPQFVYQVPISSIIGGDIITQPTFMNISSIDYSKCMNTQTTLRQECIKPNEQTKSNEKLYISCPYQMDSKLQPKIVITNTRSKANKVEEVSSLDIYERRRRLRRLKYLSNRDHNVTKDVKNDGNITPLPAIIKKIDKNDGHDANIITPDNMKSEIYKEFASTKGKTDHGGTSGSDSDDADELESKLYDSIFEEYGDEVKISENKKRKTAFLNNFKLASPEDYKEKELDLQEKMLKHDKVRSAYAAVGRLDVLLNIPQDEIPPPQRAEPVRISTCVVGEENLTMIRKKTVFLSHLKLTQASQRYKEEYEKAWQVIMKERHRRNGTTGEVSSNHAPSPSFYLDSKGQLEMMTEIKQCVNENNNLIKKMLDTVHEKKANEDSISVLAERNFSELNRLSKIADQSVKLVSGQNTGKRDLNPGFDSENIQKQCFKIKQRPPKYHKLNIPSLSKIIALKSTQECPSSVTTQATSMDEPRSSAAGVIEISTETTPVADKVIDVCCQDEEHVWPGIAKLIKSYKNYDAVRRRKITTLQRRNTSLRVEGAHITRTASRDSDRARALLAERQNLAVEENKLLLSLQRLQSAIDEVKNYTGLHDFC